MTKTNLALPKLKLGVLASHGGSNLQAIIDACEGQQISAEVKVVISNNKTAKALERAQKHYIPALHLSNFHYPDDQDLDRVLVEILKKYEVDLVIFAGYMKRRGAYFINSFKGRILNIHPALLPKFGGEGMFGMKVHEAVLASVDKISGVTVHIVDEHYDRGPILAQVKVPVLPDDTAEILAARVLVQEHKLYPQVIGRIATGEIDLKIFQ